MISKSTLLKNKELSLDLPDHIFNDVEAYHYCKITLIKLLQTHESQFRSMPKILQNDLDLIEIAATKFPEILAYVDQKYLNNPYFMRRWPKQYALKYASSQLKDDREYVLDMIQNRSARVLQYASDRLKNDYNLVFTAIQIDPDVIEYASDTLRDHFDLMKIAVTKKSDLIKFSNLLKSNKELAMIAFKVFLQDKRYQLNPFSYLHNSLYHDRELMLLAMQANGQDLYKLNENFRNDFELALIAVQSNSYSFNNVSYTLKENRVFALEVLKTHPKLLEKMIKQHRNDREIVLTALQKDGCALKYASFELSDDYDLVYVAVQQNGQALEFASPRLKDHIKICKLAILQSKDAFQYINPRLKNHPDIVLAAIKVYAIAFHLVPDHLKNRRNFIVNLLDQGFFKVDEIAPYIKNDQELMRRSIQIDPLCFKYASDTLKNDRDFVLFAIQKDINNLAYASDTLKDDREIVEIAIQHNALSLRYASDTLKNDRDFVKIAIQYNASSLKYASDILKNDREIVEIAINQNENTLAYAHPNIQQILKNEKIELKSLLDAFLIVANARNLLVDIHTDELKILEKKTIIEIKDALKIIATATQKSEIDFLFKKDQTQDIKNSFSLSIQPQVLVRDVGSLKKTMIYGVEFNMVCCRSGTFWMGTNDNDLTYPWLNSSKPQHKVRISKEFWMGETQVTQGLWIKVMGWNPSCFKGNLNLPVEMVTWYDCLQFCNQLSILEGLTPCFNLTIIEKDGHHIKNADVEWIKNTNGYRLPTEAEWEYGAKAGTELMYSGSNDLDEIAWYHLNSGEKRMSENLWIETDQDWDKYTAILDQNQNQTHEVKTKKPNAWGLYDMSGNIWELCMDQWHSEIYSSRNHEVENPILWTNLHAARVIRGASFVSHPLESLIFVRAYANAHSKDDNVGFRLFRSEP